LDFGFWIESLSPSFDFGLNSGFCHDSVAMKRKMGKGLCPCPSLGLLMARVMLCVSYAGFILNGAFLLICLTSDGLEIDRCEPEAG
jgi:hypothetical protein